MNSELQKSLQVSALPGALDGYMLVILLIMVAAGVLGGVANYYLSERQAEPASQANQANQANASRRDWARYTVLGVVAALTVPLFLNMISSNLLDAARTRPADFFVFAGFCLVYVVATRRVFENVALRLIGQIDVMKRDVAQLKAQRSEPPAGSEAAAAARAERAERTDASTKDALSYNDVEILRALSEESYVYGNLAGITDKTGLARELVSSRLTVLKNTGVIETRINERNVLHWCVSARGRQMLDEILAGAGAGPGER
jgi:DNA-binding transcriptional ArsR family regulator